MRRIPRPLQAMVCVAAVQAALNGTPALRADSGLRHDTFSMQYRDPLGAVSAGTPVTLRFRTTTGTSDTRVLRVYRYDPRTSQTTMSDTPMSFAYRRVEDGASYDFFEATVSSPGPSILYYKFRVTAGSDEAWYSDDPRYGGDEARFGGLGGATRTEPFPSFQLTVYDAGFTTPAWLRDAIVYQIFPDRFRNGDPTNDPCRPGGSTGCPAFYGGHAPAVLHPTWNEAVEDPRQTGIYNRDFFGGDLAGIKTKLDYIQGLGFNTLYLNPIFAARSNHRYDTDDYLEVDASLGGDAALEALRSELDRRGMRLILDGVFNHASSDSRYFDRYDRYPGSLGACESLGSPYRGWFRFRNGDVPCGDFGYEAFAGIDTLPSFDTSHPAVRDFLYRAESQSVLGHWYRRGADGWRFDFAEGPAPDFWRELRPVAKQMRSDGPLIAEGSYDASRFLLGDQFDSAINDRFRRNVLGFACERDRLDHAGFIEALTPSQFDHALAASREAYPPQATAVLLNVVGHHDTNRALFLLADQGDKGMSEAIQRLRLAALFQFTYVGVPMVFYGDEAAINAPSLTPPEPDPYSRAPYPWEDETGDVRTYGPPNHDMIKYYQQLAALRRSHAALRTGAFATLLTGDTSPSTKDDTTYAFARFDEREAAIVVLNKGKHENTASVPVHDYFREGTILREAVTGAPARVSDGRIEVTLRARTGAVLLRK